MNIIQKFRKATGLFVIPFCLCAFFGYNLHYMMWFRFYDIFSTCDGGMSRVQKFIRSEYG